MSRFNGDLFTGHWTTLNAGYAHISTLPEINFRTNVQKACVRHPANETAELVANEDEALHSWDNQDTANGFKSRHPGGANFLFADGSVHFIDQYIDHEMFQYLGCRNDSQPVSWKDY